MKTFDLSRIESTNLDYKAQLEIKKPKSWLKSVSAFANTGGGHILFGVTDDTHQAVGLEEGQQAASKISELIAAKITPAPRYWISELEADTEGRICIDLFVANGPAYPYYYSQDRSREVYVRHGDRSELASSNELNNLILKGQNKTFDSLPSHYKLSDVSFTLLNATYKKETGDELIFPRDLVSMGLLTESSQVTNGGLLLCDQGFLKQSKIVCTRWKGCEKGSIDRDPLDDQEFSEASLISLLTNAEAFVRNNSKSPWTIRGMHREEHSDYPFRAVREVLVNAMIHRDYQIVGTEIHIDMFDDRMEISSPGGMLNGSRIQDLDLRHVPSMRRNEIISDLFGRLHFMERRGSGIGRILNSYGKTSILPQFSSNEFFFLVILPNRSAIDPHTEPAKTKLAGTITSSNQEKPQFAGTITPLNQEKIQLAGTITPSDAETDNVDTESEKQEWKNFQNLLLKQSEGKFRQRTIQRIMALFSRYGYSYSFNRRNVAELFHIAENNASLLIKKCLAIGIIEKVKKDVYRFCKTSETE